MRRICHTQMIKMRMDAPTRRAGEVVRKLKKPWHSAASPIPKDDALRIDPDLNQAALTVYPQIEAKMAWVRGEVKALPKSSKPSM